MPQAAHIGYTPTSIAVKTTATKKYLADKIGRVKALLNNETVQKIVLFSTILALLVVAANLESIL